MARAADTCAVVALCCFAGMGVVPRNKGVGEKKVQNHFDSILTVKRSKFHTET